MTDKEIREIKRRFNSEKSNISSVVGCLVNEKREIVTRFSQPIKISDPEEATKILTVMKKTLSGKQGTNLIDIEFSTNQVAQSDEHRFLMNLKKSELKDESLVNDFFEKTASTVKLEGSFLILIAYDTYDVFTYSSDGVRDENSSEVFSYIICAVCPIKATKSSLAFSACENAFHTLSSDQVVAAPELGFMFPSFDNRTSNIYNALYYTHDITKHNTDFVNAIFNTKLPMPAAIQKDTFESCIRETVAEEYDFEVVCAVHEQVAEMVEEHKAAREEEPLTLSRQRLENVFKASGVDEKRVEAFGAKYTEAFGEAEVPPQNIVDIKHLELNTPDVVIKVNPQRSDLVTTQVIDGRKYILIRADEGVEVNGMNISIQ